LNHHNGPFGPPCSGNPPRRMAYPDSIGKITHKDVVIPGAPQYILSTLNTEKASKLEAMPVEVSWGNRTRYRGTARLQSARFRNSSFTETKKCRPNWLCGAVTPGIKSRMVQSKRSRGSRARLGRAAFVTEGGVSPRPPSCILTIFWNNR
jgi:hypothetical protein